MNLREIVHKKEKIKIAREILEGLPNWFGIPESIDEYVEESKKMPFYTVVDQECTIGFVAIKQHNDFAAEVYVMGINAQYHRRGVGKKLMACCETFCKKKGIAFLQVKTLDETHPDPYYAKTRAFYYAMGFRPLEVFPSLWDIANPCLLMIKSVDS